MICIVDDFIGMTNELGGAGRVDFKIIETLQRYAQSRGRRVLQASYSPEQRFNTPEYE